MLDTLTMLLVISFVITLMMWTLSMCNIIEDKYYECSSNITLVLLLIQALVFMVIAFKGIVT